MPSAPAVRAAREGDLDPETSRFAETSSPLAARVEELAGALAALTARVAELEARALPAAAAAPAATVAAQPPAAAPAAPVPDLTRSLALVGRTLIVFGGGYLLRALTAAGVLERRAGVVLAALYTLGWLVLAERAAARRAPASAAFHGAAAVLLGLPLLWETTVRFRDLSPPAAALVLALFLSACLAVAWRRRLLGLAWLVALAAPLAAVALLAGTHSPVLFCAALVFLGICGLLLWARGWGALGWTMATTGVVAALLAAFGALAQGRDLVAAVAVCLALCLGYLAVLAVELLARGREVGAFAAVQAALAAAAGYGGAAVLALRAGGAAAWITGAIGLLLAAACYATAFGLVPREERRKLLLASTLALAFALGGSGLLLPAAARAPVWAVLAPLLGWQALRRNRVTLGLHGACYALAAAAASGLLTAAAYAFVAPAAIPWPPLRPQAFLALAAAAVLALLPLPRPAPFWRPYRALARTLQLAILAWGAAGTALHLLAPALAGAPGTTADPALLATVRTAALSAVALLLGWASRGERFREAAWLVYPALLLAVAKLLFEDLPRGRPETLFVALALCGAAFIAAPRLARRGV